MSKEQALAGLREEMERRAAFADAARAKFLATARDDPEYGAACAARWEASDAYEKAWDAWYEETEKLSESSAELIRPVVAAAGGEPSNSNSEVPASFEQAVTEASRLTERLGYLLEIIGNGGPSLENSKTPKCV